MSAGAGRKGVRVCLCACVGVRNCAEAVRAYMYIDESRYVGPPGAYLFFYSITNLVIIYVIVDGTAHTNCVYF